MAWLGMILFPNSYAATGNQIHVSSVAPLLRDLNSGRFTVWATGAAALCTKGDTFLTNGLNGQFCNFADSRTTTQHVLQSGQRFISFKRRKFDLWSWQVRPLKSVPPWAEFYLMAKAGETAALSKNNNGSRFFLIMAVFVVQGYNFGRVKCLPGPWGKFYNILGTQPIVWSFAHVHIKA